MAYRSYPTTDYTLGKGKVLFQEGYTLVEEYVDLGNAPGLEVTIETEDKEHFSSRSGTKTRDGYVIIQNKGKATLTIDDVRADNLKRWLLASTITETAQAAQAAQTTTLTAALDKWVPIKSAGGVKVYNISNVVVKDSTEATTYTEGTDYVIDYNAGMLMALSTGSIAEDDVLHITSYDTAELNWYSVDGLSVSEVQGHLLYIADPPVGKYQDLRGYCKMKPSGNWALIGEDWQQIQFELEFVSHASYNGIVEVIERGTATT